MPLHCPNCGTPGPDEARYCMSCGHERPPVGGESPPPPPPPPAYAPGPATPSPLGQFLGRAFRGDWASAAKAAAWPLGLLLALAVALAVPSYGQDDSGGGDSGGSGSGGDVAVGWSDRLRIALALLLQAFGGGFEVRSAGPSQFGAGGGDFGSPDSPFAPAGGAEISLVPLTVTALWIGAHLIGARKLRAGVAAHEQGRTAGLEAAVRTTLLATAGVLVLGLFARPSIAGVEVASSPLLAALGALVLSLAVTAGVFRRDGLARWPARWPAAEAAVRALGTALRALGSALVLCTVVGFVVYASTEGVDGEALLFALPVLPNMGLLVLGASWGVPVEYDLQGQVGYFGGGLQHGSFGLSELGEAHNGWAVTGALALGLVCALVLALWTARRSAERREHVLAGAFFLGLYLLCTGFTGVSADIAGGIGGLGGARGAVEVAPNLAYALLFGLLWVGGAVLAAPYLPRVRGGRTDTAPGVPPVPPVSPAQPVQQAAPAPPAPPGYVPPEALAAMTTATAATAPKPHPVYPPPPPAPTPASTPTLVPAPAPAPKPRSRALLWAGTLTAAFVVGGGATAGVLLFNDGGRNTTERQSQDDKSVVVASDGPTGPATGTPSAPTSPTASPSPSAPEAATTPSPSATSAPPAPSGVPAGYRRVADPAGFSLAVPEVWSRQSADRGQITYAGSTGMEHLLIGVVSDPPYASSYQNFLTIEEKAKANQKDFRRLRLERNTFQGRPGAIWEYTFTDQQTGETLHAIDQGYIAENGTDYSIYTKARDRDWRYARETFDTALATWTLD
ncbi:zinc-ribbon domain-containing protein [Streptomyces enissocaesilis]|uniref:Zinc-ribbon domain-containing protein n=1 Tax=Streptomyces enissocaesilis TaxID=332589 RepID=A0ABP6JTJ8_9ACTN